MGQRPHLQREIEATDRQIDQLVYELYGLTEDEINGEKGTRTFSDALNARLSWVRCAGEG